MVRSTDSSLSPLSSVLVATDFTRGASLAVSRVSRLPLARRPRVTLLHVVSERVSGGSRGRERAGAAGRLEAETRRLKHALEALHVDSSRLRQAVVTGVPSEEIVERGADAELILLGRHGTRRFRDLVMGSTAERVVRLGRVPVLVVNAPARHRYRRPLVALDQSPASLAGLEMVVRLLPAGRRGPDVVHVYQTPYDHLLWRVAEAQDTATYLRDCRKEAANAIRVLLARSPAGSAVHNLLLRRGDPRGTILSAARRHRADLIAIGSHGGSHLLSALVGGVAEGVIRHATCDVLIVRPPGRAA
jgi:nucleotide-binding universal stress UspA family protein